MFQAKESPRDHDLPFDGWWGDQRSITEQVMNGIKNNRTIILESPTGSGKSLMPAMTTRIVPQGATTLVATRDLQQQYQDSFDWFDIIWGRRNYECVLPERVDQWKMLYGEKPTFEECFYSGDHKQCSEGYKCPYILAKSKAAASKAKVLNYAYAYHARWWRDNPGVLFCDEAHSLPDTIVGLTSIDVGPRARKTYRLERFPSVNGSTKRAIEPVIQWVNHAHGDVVKWIALNRKLGGDEKSLIRADNFLSRLENVKLSLGEDEIHDDEWYVRHDYKRGVLHIRPVYPMQYANRILIQQAKAKVLMSATIGLPDVLAGELNIEDYEFISTPHVIPEDQRPVYLHPNAPKINAKSGIAAYANQARIIREIFDKHHDQRGIIHTASWSHAKTLAALLDDTGRVVLADGPRIETIENFRDSPKDTVAISPSWDHGLNFYGDDARFGIVTKVPWLSWGDPIVQIRVKSPGGRAWYDWNACLRVVQACGRVVRGIDDWGMNYILDANWNRVKRFAPEWFKPQKM